MFIPYMPIVEQFLSQDFHINSLSHFHALHVYCGTGLKPKLSRNPTFMRLGIWFGLDLVKWWKLVLGNSSNRLHQIHLPRASGKCFCKTMCCCCFGLDLSVDWFIANSNDLWKKLALPDLNCLLEFRPRVTKRHSNLQANWPNVAQEGIGTASQNRCALYSSPRGM